MITIPEIQPIGEFHFPKMEVSSLLNGLPLSIIPYGPEEMVRIDCVVEVGTLCQPQFFVASFTHKLMREGTLHHTSKEISELLDFYGATFVSNTTETHTIFTLLTLKKHLKEMLNLFYEILFEPTFPESEFELLRTTERQSFRIAESKVTTIANRGLKRCIYGIEGTLGKAPKEEDYDALSLDLIKTFYHQYYVINNCQFFLSGNASEEVLSAMNAIFGSMQLQKDYKRVVADYKESVYPDKKLFIPKKDSVQSAIFVGRRLFDLYHPDFHKVSVLNTVLGGYFGSRLMSNIREDKGYTYGINSVLRRMSKGVLSIIATQAAVQYVQPLLVELYKEMDRLCNELIPEEELKMVKNYMLGDILRSADGSFSVVDAYIGVTLEKLDLPDFFHEKTCTIQSVTPKDLLEMAQKYFDKNDYFEVVAGGN